MFSSSHPTRLRSSRGLEARPSVSVLVKREALRQPIPRAGEAAALEAISSAMSDALSGYVYRVVCQHAGSLDFRSLDQILSQCFPAADEVLLKVLADLEKFVVVEGKEQRGGSLLSPDTAVIAKTPLRVCRTLAGQCGYCQDLHLCRYFVCGNCRFGAKCKNGHVLDSPHNSVILSKEGLQNLGKSDLFQLLLQNDPHLLPEVCSHYNKGNGEHGSCKYETSCTNLHLCQHFLQDDCKFGTDCKRAHSFDATTMKILSGRGLSPENIRNFCKIYKNKFLIYSYKEKLTRMPDTEKTASPSSVSPAASASSKQPSSRPVNEIDSNEICLFFIRRGCSFKDKCVRIHYHLPYKWQVLDKDGKTWKDLQNAEEIEKAFCNPANDVSPGSQAVNFISMTCGGASVRRLSTASSVTKAPHFILTTEWVWYWKNEKGVWTEYGQGMDANHAMPLTSQTLENVYQADPHSEIPISSEKHTYMLYLKDMCQQNVLYKTKREIRRRPRFVSALEVENKLKCENSSSTSVVVPAHWDRGALPDFSYKLVPLSRTDAEFLTLEKMFKQTMPKHTIISIQRNQNSSLWKVFQWQKEQMKERNGGRDVEERLLFHGTDPSLIEAICEQNFDWRVCGVHGTVYGKATLNGTQQFVWPPHAPNEMTDGVLGDLLPDLDQGITELLDTLKCNLVTSDGPEHKVPERVRSYSPEIQIVHLSLNISGIMATQSHIMKLLCDNLGCLEVGQVDSLLKKSFTVDAALLKRLMSDRSFVMVEQSSGSGELLLAKTELRICSKQDETHQCEQLHLCRFMVCGRCWFGSKCRNSHDLKSTHNSLILKKNNLHELQEAQLFQLLLQNDPSLLPEICPHYNKGNGEHGGCKFESKCTNLHLCQHFLQTTCKFGDKCKRPHSFDATAKTILESRGFSPDNISNLNKIYKNKFLISSYKEKPAVLPPSVKTAAPSTAGKLSSTQQSNKSVGQANSDEICLFNIQQGCSFKEKCVRVHHNLPYKWEILDRNGVTWKQLPNEEQIERAFCNPANDMSPEPQQVNFTLMRCDGSPVRRRSTASSVTKPPYFILTTEWIWYWKNDKKKWTEFGCSADGKNVSSITSKALEDMYVKEPSKEIRFTVANNNYVLNLKEMYQHSLTYNIKRDVRRRPVFVSYQDVKSKLKSAASSSSSSVELPDHWDKEGQQSYKIVPVSRSAEDYKKIESLFKKTLPTKSVHSIRRVQNPSLWQVFQWQKEKMKEKNGWRDVSERYLFHGTDQSLIEPISKENFDWRICGTHGTLYGKGSYFARDAKYSDTYAKPKGGHRMMFAALVLVGEYTKGKSSCVRPPQMKDKQSRSISDITMAQLVSNHIMKLLCDNLGCLEVGQVDSVLKKSFTVDAALLKRLMSDRSSFVMVEQSSGSGELLLAKTELRICSKQDETDNCGQLHLCRYLVCGRCRFGTAVMVCSHYNKGNGEHGSCKYRTSCTNLHLCLHFLQDNCKFGPTCKRAHSFDATALKNLNGRGLSPENIRNLHKIYKNKLLINGQNEKPASTGVEKVDKQCIRQRSSSSVSEADSNEICLFFVRKGCSFKEKCVRVHHNLPFKWEILNKDGVTWIQLPNEEHIERAYCNPANDISPVPMSVNFISMTCGGSPVRRLSTASSVTKPPHFILTTLWLWYWKDDQGVWTEYGQGENAKSLSSVTSKTLENLYLAEIENEIPFSVGKQDYVLCLKDMYQQNIKYKTKRDVRRRPQFVSLQDIKGKLKSDTQESSSSSSVEVPAHWDKGALSDFTYKIVPLSRSAADYKTVNLLFKRTMPTSTIRNIRRVQNPALWRVFQWQKEQMKERNGGKDVDERYLFHGTDQSLIEAICEQNFDWRICGVHGTLYGKGSYFARDAKYSDSYAKSRGGSKMMFVALVLVGEFTKGSSIYLRPPEKKRMRGFYDSCVDNEANPAIFVIFEKYQIYPEYIIEYS
ncbi:hypothetical protein NFI96_031847 [Prochilodus magdalenae]|nr:hypothetical protein NFI96_031847 [Prochilodus magdalenae]